MRERSLGCWLLIVVVGLMGGLSSAQADTFTYVDEGGKREVVEARLYATGGGAMALELADGSMKLIPEGAIMKRVPGQDPEPMTPAAKLAELKEKYGTEKFRGIVVGQYVIGVVLMAPLPKQSEKRVEMSLRKSASYMQNIETTFAAFARSAKLTPQKPKFPLVVLIFETDEIFEDFAAKETGGGLSAENIAGFYSQLTNGLYIRMSECYTFATPLHEAIHQQCFNAGVLQRLAPLPKWFVEGMATGFEGSGEKVKGDPLKLNQQYAKQINETRQIPGDLDWSIIASVDRVFVGDVFAGEAYFHAWSMHWLTFGKYRDGYTKYLRAMAALEPLTQRTPEQHRDEFERAFGKSPNRMQAEFIPAFLTAVKKEKFAPSRDDLPGVISKTLNLAGVEVMAESNGQAIAVKGTLRNISPLREMAYYVTVMTETGSYTDWVIPKLGMNSSKPLAAQQMTKVIPGAIGGPGRTFVVRVRAAPADSEDAAKWARGDVPPLRVRR